MPKKKQKTNKYLLYYLPLAGDPGYGMWPGGKCSLRTAKGERGEKGMRDKRFDHIQQVAQFSYLKHKTMIVCAAYKPSFGCLEKFHSLN